MESFDRFLYDRLDPILREMYLADLLPRQIRSGQGNADSIIALEELLDASARAGKSLGASLIATAVDVFFVAGRLDRLTQVEEQYGKTMPEIGGYRSLLKGNYDDAERSFAAAISLGKRSCRETVHSRVAQSDP